MDRARMLSSILAAAVAMHVGNALAQIAPPPLEAYGELPTTEDMAISDSGQIAMLTTTGGRRVLVVVGADLKAKSVTEVGDIKVRDLRWVGDDTIIMMRSDTQDLGERFIAHQHEFLNAMVIPADGQSDIKIVFQDDRSVLNAVTSSRGYRKVDGKWYGFFGGYPLAMGQREYYFDGGSPALYKVELGTNKSRKITSAAIGNSYDDWLIDADGNLAATMNFNNLTGGWKVADARNKVIAAGSMPEGSGEIIAFDQSGTKVLYSVRPEHEEPQYFEVPLTGGQPMRVFADTEIELFFLNGADSRLVGYLPEEGAPHFFEPAVQEVAGKVVSAFDAVGGRIEDWTPDYSKFLVTTAGNGDSGTWFLVDTKQGRSDVLARSRPQISPGQVGPISTVTYKAQDGVEIEGILTLPPGRSAKNLAVVLLPHGGPRAHDEDTFDWWAQAFASRGYAVLQPNFRGSTGYGEEFLHAGDGEWGKKMQSDVSDGLAYLVEQGIADPKRACIMGGSYGGYAAMAGVTLQNGIYRCSVAVAGVSDLKRFVQREYNETGSRELREDWLEMMGDRANLDEVSPRNFASKVTVPILLIHGRDDTVVPYEQSRMMADALKDAGKPYEFVELRDEDHWLSRSSTRKQMLEAALKFIEKHNPAD